MLKSFMKYPGGKSRELKYILPLIPTKINRYFEPFVGGGAIYLALEGITEYHINDKSVELMETYNAIKKQDKIFLSLLNEISEDWGKITEQSLNIMSWEVIDIEKFNFKVINTNELLGYYTDYYRKYMIKKKKYIDKKTSEGIKISIEDKQKMFETILKASYYATIRKIYNDNRKDKIMKNNAGYYYFIREFCYSSMFRFSKKGNFNVPYGGMSYNKKDLVEKIKYIKSKELQKKLNNTSIENLDFEIFLDKFEFEASDFIFFDPPYDTEFSTYDGNEFGRKEQIRLSNYLKKIEAKWMLVIKDTEFIRNLYPQEDEKIYYVEFNKKYSVSFMNRNEKKVNHLLITNYEV